MSRDLSIAPISLTTTASNLLGVASASFSGAAGFTPAQPRIRIKQIRIVNATQQGGSFALYVGSSSGSAVGTEVATDVSGQVADHVVAEDIVLEAGQYLTGKAGANNQFTVVISADIDF